MRLIQRKKRENELRKIKLVDRRSYRMQQLGFRSRLLAFRISTCNMEARCGLSLQRIRHLRNIVAFENDNTRL